MDITDNYDTNIQLAWNKGWLFVLHLLKLSLCGLLTALEMSAYVQSLDVYDHMISTSYSNSDGDSNVQASSALDFTMTHNYNSRDIAQETAQYVSTVWQQQKEVIVIVKYIFQPYKKLSLYHKPSYVAEFGIGDQVGYGIKFYT